MLTIRPRTEWLYVKPWSMAFIALIAFLAFVTACTGFFVMRLRAAQLARERYIRRYIFSEDLFRKLKEKYPALQEKDFYLVARALRQYFLAYHRSDSREIGMPSKVVDEMWHNFILDTKKYTDFCRKAFGTYFHHFPASKTRQGVEIERGLQRTFKLACLEENINAERPVRLPLLFAIDAKLAIPDGNLYRLPAKGIGKDNRQFETGGCGGVALSSTDQRSSWFDAEAGDGIFEGVGGSIFGEGGILGEGGLFGSDGDGAGDGGCGGGGD